MNLPRNLAKLLVVSALAVTMGLTPAASGSQPNHAPLRSALPQTDGRIVVQDFISNQIYTLNPDGSSLVQVTHLKSDDFPSDPVWSPDSSHILFWIGRDGGALIYEMNADGTGLRTVTADDPGVFDITPDYTPDGSHVVFSRCEDRGCAIYSAAIDGTDMQPLTRYRRGIHQGVDFHPQVSPDGDWVSFVRNDTNGILSRVWLMRLDGTEAHPITPVKLEAGGRQKWSSDGSVIYLEAPARGWGNHIFSIRPDGSDLRQLTFSEYPNGDFDAAGSPRGSRVVFNSDRRHADPVNVGDLFIMRADGTNQHLVETGLTLPLDPDWGSAPLQTGPSVVLPSSARSPSPAQLRAAELRQRQPSSAESWLHARVHVRW